MKDQLVAVLEAVRLGQCDLAGYLRNGEKNPRETLEHINAPLGEQGVCGRTAALGRAVKPQHRAWEGRAHVCFPARDEVKTWGFMPGATARRWTWTICAGTASVRSQ